MPEFSAIFKNQNIFYGIRRVSWQIEKEKLKLIELKNTSKYKKNQ